MSANGGQVAAGLLLVVAAIWLILQTVAGGLAGRLQSLGSSGSGSTSSGGGPLSGPTGTPPKNLAGDAGAAALSSALPGFLGPLGVAYDVKGAVSGAGQAAGQLGKAVDKGKIALGAAAVPFL